MRQHNAVDGRKCWSTARERERLKARFLIRNRVASEAMTTTTTTSSSISSSSFQQLPASTRTTTTSRINLATTITNLSQQDDDDNTVDCIFGDKKNGMIVRQIARYIQNGDRSKFSLSFMSQHNTILSMAIPITYLQQQQEDILSHAIQLCTAWFGLEYSTLLQEYVESLSTFTFIEYAVWLGKYSIVGALIVGGINPCISSQYNYNYLLNKWYEPTHDGTPAKLLPPDSKVVEWQERLRIIGTLVLRRFFDSFPLPLSTYIVKRVVDMRRDANRDYRIKAENNQCQSIPTTTCPICDEFIPLGCLLEFIPCSHNFCELCLWKDLLSNIDGRGECKDVVLCPVCEIVGLGPSTVNVMRNVNNGQSEHCTEQRRQERGETVSSPTAKSRISRDKLLQLPKNRQELKNVHKKRKKLTEQQHLASSWYEAVIPSLGLTQDVRRDKFFSNIDRNAIHYIRGCLEAGVDINLTNEYGQTALFIATWKENIALVDLLLRYGADPYIAANGGTTVATLCRQHQNANIYDLLNKYSDGEESKACVTSQVNPLASCIPMQDVASPLPLQVLIEEGMDHPGAGSYMIDSTLSSHAVHCLLALWNSLPKDISHKKKSTLPCSIRSYFCDAEGYIRLLLQRIIEMAGLTSSPLVFPHMRFLAYSQAGTTLAPHVDLCRVDAVTGRRSTHSFLLYLTTCDQGGETSLLADLSKEQSLAIIAPRSGRLLLFPHSCPHEGKGVIDVPKVLLRGEVLLS